jgi:predicted RNA binding protein YcfA (HicA-like mRNA interferase family)
VDKLRDDIERLKKARRSVRPDVLHELLVRAGFALRAGKGDHRIYTHKLYPGILTIDPRTPHLLPVYVSKSIRAIEMVLNNQEVVEDDNDDD